VNVKSAARLLRISWDEAWHLMDRAVACGLATKTPSVPADVGVDEKAAGPGRHYITVVSDLDAGTVSTSPMSAAKASLDGYFARFTPAQREQIQAVAMDMWEALRQLRAGVPARPGQHDCLRRVHVMGYLTEAVDTVRKREHRALAAAGDTRLAGSKYMWLYVAQNLPARHADRFAALRTVDLKTGRVWAIKERRRHLWTYHRRGWGAKHWRRWYFWATRCRLPPVIDAAHTPLKRHEAGLLSYVEHRITNAAAESLNSCIQAIRVAARGYRNRENFTTAMYFQCGGLQLYPPTVSHGLPGGAHWREPRAGSGRLGVEVWAHEGEEARCLPTEGREAERSRSSPLS
jgi:transposase